MPRSKPTPTDDTQRFRQAFGRLGAERRYRPDEDHTELEREVKALALKQYVKKVVDSAPPLTAAQIDRIAAVLREAPNA